MKDVEEGRVGHKKDSGGILTFLGLHRLPLYFPTFSGFYNSKAFISGEVELVKLPVNTKEGIQGKDERMKE